MTVNIHPEAVKAYRRRKDWTQKDLAEATRGRDKVSEPTIKRIESAKDESYPARDRIAKSLAKALGVTVEDLSKPPTPQEDRERELRELGYRWLRVPLDGETALSYEMVQHLYGISIRSQVEMAPLFTALLAEGSLAWRRERLAEIEQAANRLDSLGGGHFSFAHAAYRALDGAAVERESIEQRDLFGQHVGDEAFDLGFDPSRNNPFADYLEHLVTTLNPQVIGIEQEGNAPADAAEGNEAPAGEGAESDASEEEVEKGPELGYIGLDKDFGWKTVEGLPRYRIGADIIKEITNEDPDAEYALVRGHVHLKDIPDELRAKDRKDERVRWMVSRIPAEEFAERKRIFASLSPELDSDTLEALQTTEASQENGDA